MKFPWVCVKWLQIKASNSYAFESIIKYCQVLAEETAAHQIRGEKRLEVEQEASAGDLLQPPAAGFLGVGKVLVQLFSNIIKLPVNTNKEKRKVSTGEEAFELKRSRYHLPGWGQRAGAQRKHTLMQQETDKTPCPAAAGSLNLDTKQSNVKRQLVRTHFSQKIQKYNWAEQKKGLKNDTLKKVEWKLLING